MAASRSAPRRLPKGDSAERRARGPRLNTNRKGPLRALVSCSSPPRAEKPALGPWVGLGASTGVGVHRGLCWPHRPLAPSPLGEGASCRRLPALPCLIVGASEWAHRFLRPTGHPAWRSGTRVFRGQSPVPSPLRRLGETSRVPRCFAGALPISRCGAHPQYKSPERKWSAEPAPGLGCRRAGVRLAAGPGRKAASPCPVAPAQMCSERSTGSASAIKARKASPPTRTRNS